MHECKNDTLFANWIWFIAPSHRADSLPERDTLTICIMVATGVWHKSLCSKYLNNHTIHLYKDFEFSIELFDLESGLDFHRNQKHYLVDASLHWNLNRKSLNSLPDSTCRIMFLWVSPTVVLTHAPGHHRNRDIYDINFFSPFALCLFIYLFIFHTAFQSCKCLVQLQKLMFMNTQQSEWQYYMWVWVSLCRLHWWHRSIAVCVCQCETGVWLCVWMRIKEIRVLVSSQTASSSACI